MTENDGTSRRKLMGAFGSAISASLLSGCIDKHVSENINSNLTTENINISIFQTSSLQQINESINGKCHTLKLCKNYLEKELSIIDKNININIVKNPVELQAYAEKESSEAYELWDDYFNSKVLQENKSTHSNILLSNVKVKNNVDGVATTCNICDSNHKNTSMIFNAYTLARHESTTIDDVQVLNNKLDPLATVMHEVGHNLGWNHDVGHAWYDKNEQVIKTTPMLSYYVYDEEYAGKYNKFGDEIVNPDSYDVPVKQVPYLNPKVSYNQIKY